jgi:hypothetical protein
MVRPSERVRVQALQCDLFVALALVALLHCYRLLSRHIPFGITNEPRFESDESGRPSIFFRLLSGMIHLLR